MSVNLEIRDGSSHWWASTDIWVVPGSDPTGPIGRPIAGGTAFLWARVANHGRSDALGARVDFWWADPSAQVLRSTATFIGAGNVDVPAGGSGDVLCLSPWAVSFANNGHQCLVAVANYPGSSVPTPAPDDFDPPNYPEIAQRNISVLPTQSLNVAHLVQIAAGPRRKKAVRVSIELGGELGEPVLASLGLKGYRLDADARIDVGLGLSQRGVPKDEDLGPAELEIAVKPGQRTGVYAAVRAALGPMRYRPVHVIEQEGETTLGGYTFVVVGAENEESAR